MRISLLVPYAATNTQESEHKDRSDRLGLGSRRRSSSFSDQGQKSETSSLYSGDTTFGWGRMRRSSSSLNLQETARRGTDAGLVFKVVSSEPWRLHSIKIDVFHPDTTHRETDIGSSFNPGGAQDSLPHSSSSSDFHISHHLIIAPSDVPEDEYVIYNFIFEIETHFLTPYSF